MFKRQIQIALVKGSRKRDETSVDEPQMSEEDVLEMIKTVVTGVGFVTLELMVSYMTLDTIRKIAVNRLSK